MKYYRTMNNPIMILTLDDETKIPLQDESDLSKICNTKGLSSELTIANRTFMKSNIIGIKFTDGFNLTKIPNYFCYRCNNLNSNFTIPNTVTEIGNYFLGTCESFNSEIQFPDSLNIIGNNFMYHCINFNKSIGSLHLTSLGYSFLEECTAFNQRIDTAGWTFDILQHNFMLGCQNFDWTFSLDNFKQINANFLAGCWNYKQPVMLRSNIEKIDAHGFMVNCKNFTGSIYVDIDPNNFQFYGSANGNTDDSLLSTINSTDLMYTRGVSIQGIHQTDFVEKFSSNPASGYYRKLRY